MIDACPSVTAWRVARHRAKHQLLENGAVFSDPLAIPILGEHVGILAAESDAVGEKNFRLFMAIRSRIAEDRLAKAVQRGVRQAIVMGGGVDTFGLRNPHKSSGLAVFEVDRPIMQDWKRRHLAQIGLSAPASLTFVPVDFEQDSLNSCLVSAGFDPTQPAFFSWLGVVPYLTQESIENTLRFVASIPSSEIVFDYGEPIENYEGSHRTLMEERNAFVASVGEPWLSRFNPDEMHAILRKCRLNNFTDYDRVGISSYFGWPTKETNSKASPHVIDALSA
ncbi:SAM-dependent methyltransferase [Wolbachia endosymbiont of Drosophila nikananu]|uniref:class I SAM-dependent methyltransferase n=1 Tax=Wolbachia endosymbiont of Drosophila nikananu TaxID=375550 RepID=UPI0023A932B9|nr:SAM-dependent methyltransferase [Wolbachia endosymbiont of Drosophila nikananu]MDE5060732.1 SAM-dependent methyltransferase [Wolbachia endosymbiont of Drosophila nikananu]